jgi:hypothetical protein
VFEDLREEAAFYNSIGQSEEVRNPANGVYAWTIEEALEAVKSGLADGLSVGGGLFGASPKLFAKRFNNREFGERLRAHTIANWYKETVSC